MMMNCASRLSDGVTGSVDFITLIGVTLFENCLLALNADVQNVVTTE